MAGIQWTSSSINSFFSTSLNQSKSGMNGLYSLLGDASLIKKGSYHKLMDAYVKQVKSSSSSTDKSDKTDKTDKSDKKQTNSTYDKKGIKATTTDSILDTLI